MPLTSALLPLLEKHFGFTSFRPQQEDIMENLLSGKDTLVLMPTGGGKSLCYQLPAVYSPGMALVVSPLISLMKDQVDSLRANGISAAFLNSSLTQMEQEITLQDAQNGTLKLLYVAPERFAVPAFQAMLHTLDLSFIAIDEAHCISQWGHDFRPDYRTLRMIRDQFPRLPIIALTATATERVRVDIMEQLNLKDPKVFLSSFNRPNLSYHVRPKKQAYGTLLSLLKQYQNASSIIYCFSRKDTEALAADLTAEGIKTLPYHAGLEGNLRKETQEKFIRDEVQVIAATVAFGMGIDKPDVRLVVHWDLPKNLEGYYQETGRAGRDGLPSDCVLFYSAGDRHKHAFFIDSVPDEKEREESYKKLAQMMEYCELSSCRRFYLLKYFGETHNEETCTSCDACLTPQELFDATDIAQKILSAVIRTGERFGAHYVISVLRGKENDDIFKRNHHSLSVHGIAEEKSDGELQYVIRQLVQKGLLIREEGKYPTLRVSDDGKIWLKERATLTLPVERKAETSGRSKSKDTAPYNEELFDELRIIRKHIADSRNVPPFVIFGDASLREMAQYFPQTRENFARITGVGEKKLEEFGEQFVSVIKRFAETHTVEEQTPPRERRGRRSANGGSTTYDESKRLLEEMRTIEEIASMRGLAPGTIIQHIEYLTKRGDCPDVRYLRPSEQDMEVFRQAFSAFQGDALKPVFDYLKGTYSYDQLRLGRVFLTLEAVLV
jgi:ATP-dependent DNA helicase RecQ